MSDLEEEGVARVADDQADVRRIGGATTPAPAIDASTRPVAKPLAMRARRRLGARVEMAGMPPPFLPVLLVITLLPVAAALQMTVSSAIGVR
ncbi:hypothetical protein CKY39_13140 [Variovorax boronicumulans]|uniref:Uncharacterized protein n=1 Tax=Variovorax boronicumulans TaxID=436515 RepID=A0A250DIT9_9BURK|nr:hypothetical protein CKY39_13140 [Variovorax boronicumulans]